MNRELKRNADPDSPSSDSDAPVRSQANDLGLELYRQQTLLLVMTARMRETAARLDLGNPVDPARLRRALDVHRRYLLEVHEQDEDRVARALLRVRPHEARRLVEECRSEHPRGDAFLRTAGGLLLQDLSPGSDARRRLSQLFVDEADRIERHQTWEEETLHPHLNSWLPKSVRTRLLGEMRKFNAARVDAEIALVSWASQHHPSAD